MIRKTAIVILIGTAISLVYSCINTPDNLSYSNPSEQIIPGNRQINWNPGIPGGIPDVTGPIENIVDHGADPTGIHDSKRAITSAIGALPASGGVVFIPQGTFRIGSKISIRRDRIIFRGTGQKSKLFVESDGDCIQIATYQRGSWQRLPDGATKDSITVTVEDGSKFTPGQFAEIEQDNDSLLMYTKPEWIQSWAENSVGQMLEIEGVLGNKITFKSPVHFDFRGDLNARIRPQGLVKHVGFEDLYIEKKVAKVIR